MTQALKRFDEDGDEVISQAELDEFEGNASGDMTGDRNPGLLRVIPILAMPQSKIESTIRSVAEQYTFTDSISKSDFFAWSDDRFRKLDPQAVDKGVTRSTLKKLQEIEPDLSLYGTFPDSSTQSSPLARLWLKEHTPEVSLDESQSAQRAQWQSPTCIVHVQVVDAHSATIRDNATKLLQTAKSNAAFRQAIEAQLMLPPRSAFEYLEENAERTDADAWRWYTSSKDALVYLQWQPSRRIWFDMLDHNGDRKVSHSEIVAFAKRSANFDRDNSGDLDPNELPLCLNLTIKRGVFTPTTLLQRGPDLEKSGTPVPSVPTWFAGMDYNSDGSVTKSEFLGSERSFDELDKDRDGIITAREVYEPQ